MPRRTAIALAAVVATGTLVAAPAVVLPATAAAAPASPQEHEQATAGPELAALAPGTGCTVRTTSYPFAFVGDDNPYYLAAGGDFEGWSRWFGAGITKTDENEPWRVGGPEDRSSAVLLRTGSSLSAPAMCVRDSEPTLRFFYRSPGLDGARLHVRMRTTSSASSTARTYVLDGSRAGWALSPPLQIVDDTDHSGTQNLLLDFVSAGGTWHIDDVYVDPWKWTLK